jgi:hypothetical protein
MDFLATDGARTVAVLVLAGMVIFDVVWEWWRR